MMREEDVHGIHWLLYTYWKWLRVASLVMDEYPYYGVNFQGDSDMVFHPGMDLDDKGKKFFGF